MGSQRPDLERVRQAAGHCDTPEIPWLIN